MISACLHMIVEGKQSTKKLIEVGQETTTVSPLGHFNFNIADLVLLKGVFQAAHELNLR
jgi:hypothetical protein